MTQLAIAALRPWVLAFDVAGTPQPQGSKALINGRLVEQANLPTAKLRGGRLRSWREAVATWATVQMRRQHLELTTAPVKLTCKFFMQRPPSHRRKSGRLTSKAPRYPGKPDLSKLIRAVEDALTGIAWRDDAQVALYHLCSKDFVDRDPGCHVRIEVLS